MSDESEQHILLKTWHNALKRATDFDAWGQPIEASEIYVGLSKQLFTSANDRSCNLFSKYQKRTLEKIALCLDARKANLTKNETPKTACVDLHDLKLLENTLANWLIDGCDEGDGCEFPIEFSSTGVHPKCSYPQEEGDVEKGISELLNTTGKCNLLPKPLPISGKSFLTVLIDQIGVKDESQYLDPYISISARGPSGQCLESNQDTPTASDKLDKAIVFNCDVHIQSVVESLPPGFAIFFEFKHFKPKKDVFSTKCWSFLEQDEIKDGPVALELYKKPADFKRKSLKLLTVKPLFLHLHLSLNR